MKKGVLFLTSLVAIASLAFTLVLTYRYFQENNVTKEKGMIKKVTLEIKDLKGELEEKSVEKEDIKKKNQEKVKVLEVWQKELEKFQK